MDPRLTVVEREKKLHEAIVSEMPEISLEDIKNMKKGFSVIREVPDSKLLGGKENQQRILGEIISFIQEGEVFTASLVEKMKNPFVIKMFLVGYEIEVDNNS